MTKDWIMYRIILTVISILALGGIWYFFFYPPEVLQRHTQGALNGFSEAVATKDRANIGAAMKALLADDAKVRFSVSMVSGGGAARPEAEDFSKADFITFVDNILYSLSDYAYSAPPRLDAFTISADRKTAAVVFSSKERAEGPDWVAGTKLNMQFSSDTLCHGEVRFAPEPQLENADCAMQLRMAPKPGQLY